MKKNYWFYQCDKCNIIFINKPEAKEHNKIYNHAIKGMFEE